MDPVALGNGATEFVRGGDAMLGHAKSVADLAALRTAFAGAGETVWPAVEARLAELTRRLETVQQQAMNTGTVLRAASGGSTTIDQVNSTTMRM
jgi:hypothetical protein